MRTEINCERRATANSTLATSGILSLLDNFVLAESSVPRTNPSSYRDAENRHLRQARKRYASLNKH